MRNADRWFLKVVLVGLLMFSLPVSARELPGVVILATGGTIAGTASSSNTAVYEAGQVEVADLLEGVPGLDRLARVSSQQVCNIDSSNITASIWLTLAATIDALSMKETVNGIVVTHGTDTMEETAWFLDLVLKTDKPVVLTGSMRPSTSIGADGPANLYNAVAVAASPRSRGRGVLVVMNDSIFGARDVTKTSTSDLDAFKSLNNGPLGSVVFGDVHFYRSPDRSHAQGSAFAVDERTVLPRVAIVYGYAFNRPDAIEFLVDAGVEGIVYAGTGDGMINEALVPALKKARRRGVAVVRSSRCGSGRVVRDSMQGLDSSAGLVPADNLNPQKARILLMLGLMKTSDPEKLDAMFSRY